MISFFEVVSSTFASPLVLEPLLRRVMLRAEPAIRQYLLHDLHGVLHFGEVVHLVLHRGASLQLLLNLVLLFQIFYLLVVFTEGRDIPESLFQLLGDLFLLSV